MLRNLAGLTAAVLTLTLGVASGSAHASLPADAVVAGATSGSELTTWSALTGADALGRVLPSSAQVGAERTDRLVGVRYMPWHGQNDATDYKNIFNLQSIVDAEPSAPQDHDSSVFPDAKHFAYWNQPLFGYYRSDDAWVIRRHLQMLADAGVDFIQVDITNNREFRPQINLIMTVIEQMQREGRDAPLVTLHTHNRNGAGQPDSSTVFMNDVYSTFYAPTAPYRHPTTWLQLKGKPLIVGSNPSATVSSFFTVRYPQWPNEQPQASNGWDWISFQTPQHVNYNSAGEKEQITVAVAANSNSTAKFADTAWYGLAGAHGRGWHNGAEDTSPQALQSGAYFQEQWDFAIQQDPQIVLVEGWNEWSAGNWQQMNNDRSDPLAFYDAASDRYSRDVEPTAGALGDNYYMQLIENIRRFKGTTPALTPGSPRTIDLAGSFDQWSTVSPKFMSSTSAFTDRNHAGTGSTHYTTQSTRNVFAFSKVARDTSNFYFMTQTADAVSAPGDRWMTLFLDTDANPVNGWSGYDFIVRKTSPSASTYVLQANVGGYNWTTVSPVSYRVENDKIMLSVPRSALGLTTDPATVSFKWADNWSQDGAVTDFYTNGTSAPYGRLNFFYSTGGTSQSSDPVPAQPAAAPALTQGVTRRESSDLLTEYTDYSGTGQQWNRTVSDSAASGGSYAGLVAGSGDTDAYYLNTISTLFEGDAVRWITRTAPDGVEQAEVFIDGVSYGKISMRSTTVHNQKTVFSATGLGGGPHEIFIKCDNRFGTICYHDAFEIIRGASNLPAAAAGQNIAAAAAVTASSNSAARWYAVGAPQTRDDSLTTWWRPAATTVQWLRYDFTRNQQVDRVEITPSTATANAGTQYAVQGLVNGQLTTLATGSIGSSRVLAQFAAVSTPWIRVEFNPSTDLSIAEVRIANGALGAGPAVPTDLAAGKPATASSDNGSTYNASKAVDGNATTYWCASGPAKPQWLQVDLQAKKDIDSVITTFYSQDTWEYWVQGSDDQQSWTTLSNHSNVAASKYTDGVFGSYRYIRVRVLDAPDNWAAIRSIQVLGH
ncbi:discoidin domain-containing protein [Herbiconiux sp. A18JL235]|uniref:Discoidin domain-containing protein n=1 Tax=Herbiconiux sp. A18JL235 TaxID=3152363 RepID=A0AB39BGY4_9MICO